MLKTSAAPPPAGFSENRHSTGGDGTDALFGGDGNDMLVAGDGFDRLDGGAGDDAAAFTGTNCHDFIRVSRVATPGGPEVVFRDWFAVTRALFFNGETISVSGGSGNDVIIMDPSAGPFWKAAFFGGSGNDRLIGGVLNDMLDGGTGNNALQGGGGTDLLLRGRIAPAPRAPLGA